ncbi:hypothetical protein HAX54_040606 [Datura stramonium]|uniref:Gfo/Idh/MocA-like oxidoreductase N-terminal domain-containing protein n=1 Tax=Datura stramonium TaxID=4076 RepID=A0ABS8VR39_DATST|nr:hypothetical protein [Datura stramonium]
MAESAAPVRFGILGCANIARKVSRAIALVPNATISAVGSRAIEKATAFAKENGYPSTTKIYGSYEAVLDDPEVDAVYVPLPTSLHLKWAVLAAQKKKHVLLEKPVALNMKELDAILEACESNGMQYMDATMWMHHPRTAKMKEFLSDSQRFGQLKSVHSTFAYLGNSEFLKNDIRIKADLDALGALGDADAKFAAKHVVMSNFLSYSKINSQNNAVKNLDMTFPEKILDVSSFSEGQITVV